MPSSPQAPVYLVKVGNRVGVKGWSVAPHDFLRKTENLCLSFPHCFPFRMVLLSMLFFHSAFFLISRVAYEWCFLFVLF